MRRRPLWNGWNPIKISPECQQLSTNPCSDLTISTEIKNNSNRVLSIFSYTHLFKNGWSFESTKRNELFEPLPWSSRKFQTKRYNFVAGNLVLMYLSHIIRLFKKQSITHSNSLISNKNENILYDNPIKFRSATEIKQRSI